MDLNSLHGYRVRIGTINNVNGITETLLEGRGVSVFPCSNVPKNQNLHFAIFHHSLKVSLVPSLWNGRKGQV